MNHELFIGQISASCEENCFSAQYRKVGRFICKFLNDGNESEDEFLSNLLAANDGEITDVDSPDLNKWMTYESPGSFKLRFAIII